MRARRNGVALAMLANLEEWVGYCGRVAEALVTRYGLSEPAAGFFRFFTGPAPASPSRRRLWSPPGLPRAKTRRRRSAALALHAYEIAFWDALADGLG